MEIFIHSKGRQLLIKGEFNEETGDFLVDRWATDRYGEEYELNDDEVDEARLVLFQEKRKQK